MSKLTKALDGNTGAILAGGGMAALLCLGAYLSFGTQGQDPLPVNATATEPSQTQAAEVAAQEVEIVEAEPAEVAPTAAPSFDALRREPDGTTIIAGRAEPLSDVKILVDGEQVGSVTADSTGGFATIANLPAGDTAQVVSLSARNGEEVTASIDEVILAPRALPVPVLPKLEQTTALQSDTEALETPEATSSVNKAPLETETEVEPPRIAVLKSDSSGVSLMSPTVASEIAIDTIGYSELGEVQLAGRAQPDTAKVRVYLNNRSVISLPVSADGRWRGDLPDVDEGVYTLRVDEVNAAGTVSSRVETPFKRESAEVLAQASANIEGPIKSITVQTGATLWAIARDRYGDGTLYVRVFEANSDSIRDPDLIYPGQVFDLPN